MIKLTGILSESLGGTCTFRGYAKYNEIVDLSYPHPGYQREAEDDHVDEISSFITSGSNSFSPEIVLAYTTQYDYYAAGASSDIDAINDIRSGKGFTSNIDGISFKKERSIGNGFLYTVSIPEKKYEADEEKPFRRVDGNHRLQAIEKLISAGQMRSTYIIPFCIILFADNESLKDEKTIFHNINSKAIPIQSEKLLNSIIPKTNDRIMFSDVELEDKFGKEYLLIRKALHNKPLLYRKLLSIAWIKASPLKTLLDLIGFIETEHGKIENMEQEEAFFTAIAATLNHTTPVTSHSLSLAPGLFFLLASQHYLIEISDIDPAEKTQHYIDHLTAWAKKYKVSEAQVNTEENAAANAVCIRSIYDQYVKSSEQTIFMSRCFASEYNENENAIRRAIEDVNREKNTTIKLVRVDAHTEGVTGQISDRVFKEMEKAGLVIADLSSGKLNIPHEIGYAMGLKKDLIIIHNGTNEDAEIHTPSNIRMFEQIRFNGDYQTLQDEIKRRLIDYYKL